MAKNSALFYLPIVDVAWIFICLIVVLLMTCFLDHMDDIDKVPYISNLGDRHPESSVFTLLFCVGGFLSSTVMACRYGQVAALLKDVQLVTEAAEAGAKLPPWIARSNVAALIFGVLMGIGAAITGCFQLSSSIPLHYLGATLLCTSAIVCVVLHTVLSSELAARGIEPYAHPTMLVVRTVLAATCASALLIFLFRIHKNILGQQQDRTYLIVRACCQWMGAVSLSLFILTFVHEFRRLHCKVTFYTVLDEVVQEEAEQASF